MSLASQDAEEEKKKQSSAAATSNITANKRVRRIRKRKREEEYTDKDRAAAVTLGSRDIKQSLKAKKKRERKMRLSLDFMSSEEYLASMLTVEALYQLKVRKTPQAALATLNKALELQPTHKGALVARSQCHIKLGDANSALKDAETSLGKNETFIQGLYHYAEALYQLGEFEKSLIAFHQGYRLRKDMECFRIGVQKSQDAIKRAIGSRTATQMSNLDEILSIIEELQESKRKAVSTCKDEDLLVNILRRRFGDKTISLTKAQSKQKNQWITREVLGQMYMDHQYLAKFIHRSDVKQQMGHAEELRETAKDGLNYLENREKFWRQQNPLYSRKMMANVINNNSLLAKLNSSSQQPPSTVPAANHNRVKSVNADKAGQTSFVSTPRLTMNNKVNRN
ncbi:tetratricopeptide repeat protein 25 isoform X2 [Folsomia candida]|nr:tetratricopeptide repeat protein 25 isoform X2 [Folsomia candida]